MLPIRIGNLEDLKKRTKVSQVPQDRNVQLGVPSPDLRRVYPHVRPRRPRPLRRVAPPRRRHRPPLLQDWDSALSWSFLPVLDSFNTFPK